METTIKNCNGCGSERNDDNWGYRVYQPECKRCDQRMELDDELLEIAYAEKLLRTDKSKTELWHDVARLQVRSMRFQKEARATIESWEDTRMWKLVDQLWESLDGDVDRDDTWGLFVDQLGMPDKRSKEYEVTVTITVYVDATDEDDAQEKAEEEISDNTYRYLRDADYECYEQ